MNCKRLIVVLVGGLCTILSAQNLQVHYDFGEGRNYVTTTFEVFKADRLGSTYFFLDFDFNFKNKTSIGNGSYRNVGLAYAELSRVFTFSDKIPLGVQIEYDGGVGMNSDGKGLLMNNALLCGLNYSYHNKDYTQIYGVQVLYKYIMGKEPASFQLTGTWSISWWKNRFTFTGFADFWWERNENVFDMHGRLLETPKKSSLVFITEPQLWWNIIPCLSIGTETEMSVNFAGTAGFKCCPTVAVKLTFDKINDSIVAKKRTTDEQESDVVVP